MAAETVSFNLNAQTISDTALAKVRSVAKASGYLVFRVTFKDGNVRFFRGQPGLPGEEVQRGSIGTGTISVKVQGYVCEGAV